MSGRKPSLQIAPLILSCEGLRGRKDVQTTVLLKCSSRQVKWSLLVPKLSRKWHVKLMGLPHGSAESLR